MRKTILFAFAVALYGCAATPEQLADRCSGYGFQRGTTAFAGCMQREEHADDVARNNAWGAFGDGLAQGNQRQAKPAQTYQPIRKPDPGIGLTQPAPVTTTTECFSNGAGNLTCKTVNR